MSADITNGKRGRSRDKRRIRWRFNWNEESTKRGVAMIFTSLSTLLGLRFGPEVAAAVASLGLGIVGILGAFRSEEAE